jgi:pimeloyl-ACP methyl ester carboxylesterase
MSLKKRSLGGDKILYKKDDHKREPSCPQIKRGTTESANVSIPVAMSAFPDELFQAPRSWTERAYPNLIYYNKLDKGGHFAAWEQPELFCAEVRTGFRSLR